MRTRGFLEQHAGPLPKLAVLLAWAELIAACLPMQAYTEAFQPSDDVALIVHSSYGDHFWEQQLQDSMRNSSQPALLFFQVHP